MDKIKILVVDDESRMRKLVHDFLAREGYEVLETGLIRIGVFPSVAAHWIPRIIKRFSADYPGIDYKLRDRKSTRLNSSHSK